MVGVYRYRGLVSHDEYSEQVFIWMWSSMYRYGSGKKDRGKRGGEHVRKNEISIG